ncbi:MAG: T9SS type A sorting domain-containing protein [Bacteroidales bacterium]|jgi:hypothetical protein
MKAIILTILLFPQLNQVFTQTIPADSLYLGQNPPGETPVIFELPVSDGWDTGERIAISSDGTEIYFGEHNSSGSHRIKYLSYSDNSWNGPYVLFEGSAPALSITGDTLFTQRYPDYISYTYFSIREDTSWSTPQTFLEGTDIYYVQNTNTGNYYVAKGGSIGGLGGGDIARMEISGSGTEYYSLGAPLNSSGKENDFYMAKDESFIIFTYNPSPSPPFTIKHNLYTSFKKGDGTWTNPVSLGSAINTSENYEVAPFVSSDNKYLFFNRASGTSENIHWVRIDNILDSLRNISITGEVTYNSIEQNIRVYPNPATDRIEIKGITFGSDVTVFDLSGQPVLTKNMDGSPGIDISGLPKGIYLVQIMQSGHVPEIRKVIKN